MKILLFTGYYLPGFKGGGPIKTIANLISTTSDDISYNIVTRDRDLGDQKSYSDVDIGQWNQIGNSSVFYAVNGFKGLMKISEIVLKTDYDLIYLNSFFSVRFSLIPLLIAKVTGKYIVLSPRGEFSEGALSLKSFKKKIYIFLFKFFRLHNNVVFQSSTVFESKDIKKVLSYQTVIFVAENIGSQQYANNLVNRNCKALNIVFLSRVSPMKNLTYALDILSKVTCSVIFDIYGPIEDKLYWEQCNKIISTLSKNICVKYKGILPPSEVVDTLAKYDLFFMPTKGENFGHAITEALCAGLPILVANTTPWRDLKTKGIGWDIPLDKPEMFVKAIENASAMGVDEYQTFRNSILSWAKAKFNQRDAIESNIALFNYTIEENR